MLQVVNTGRDELITFVHAASTDVTSKNKKWGVGGVALCLLQALMLADQNVLMAFVYVASAGVVRTKYVGSRWLCCKALIQSLKVVLVTFIYAANTKLSSQYVMTTL